MSSCSDQREKESLEAYLDAVPDTGVQFLAPGYVAPLAATLCEDCASASVP